MDLKKKFLYSAIRISVLIIIVCGIVSYYENKCDDYIAEIFEAKEERDKYIGMNTALTSEIKAMERKILSDEFILKENAKISEELDAVIAEIAWHEERWETLKSQKNNLYVRHQKGTQRNSYFNSYVGDITTKVYHDPACDFLDVIDYDDKVIINRNRFGAPEDYSPCEWCIRK